jgi:hypothetical protein
VWHAIEGGCTVADMSDMRVTEEQVGAWVEAYVRAWESYDRDEIAALF